MRKIADISKYQYLGIYKRHTYVLKTLSMGRALVAVKSINGTGYDPLKREGKSKPYIAFSKVDCKKEKNILEYANKYGVPFNINQIYSCKPRCRKNCHLWCKYHQSKAIINAV